MRNPTIRREEARARTQPLRCASYVRVAVETGRSLAALDAQRDRCLAWIRNHIGGSWIASFEEVGFPGLGLERPALQHLLADVAAGAIDVVVVSHVDRLTRCPRELARLMTIFYDAGVSLVLAVGPAPTRYAVDAGLGVRGGTAP